MTKGLNIIESSREWLFIPGETKSDNFYTLTADKSKNQTQDKISIYKLKQKRKKYWGMSGELASS